MRLTRSIAWLFFAAIMYLILTEVLSPWASLPALGNIGFTLVFVAFAITHCAACAGWKKTGIFFALAAVISYLLEEVGVSTGWIYGAYHYSDMLGPKLGHVPVLIPLAWFMMIYPSWMVARALTPGINLRSIAGLVASAFIAALVMTAWDTVMDPGMSAAGNWVWEKGGAYFGVPLHNYFGWLLTTFLVYLGAGLLRTAGTGAHIARGFPALPVIVYAFYSLAYIVPRPRAALQVVALFAMGMPAFLALIHIWLIPAGSEEGPAAAHLSAE
jgi:uncharacterized membrane protein